MSMVYVDETKPTHDPAVVCKVCGGDDSLKLVNGEFVCREKHTYHKKLFIPSPYKMRGSRW